MKDNEKWVRKQRKILTVMVCDVQYQCVTIINLFFQEQPDILSDKKANDTQSNKKLGDISSNHLVSSIEA